LAAVVLTTAANTVQAFQMAVAPMRFEFELGPRPVTRALKLINQSDEDMEIAIRVANFDMDENNNLREIAPSANSLDQSIIIRPLKFSVKAGETRTIRFAVRPFKRPKAGEHRAVIFLERADKPKQNKGKINVGFRFGVVIYAHAGTPVRRAQLHGVAADPGGIRFDIQSSGSAHVRMTGTYGVWPAATFPGNTIAAAMIAPSEFNRNKAHMPRGASAADLLPNLPVLPGSRRSLIAHFKKKLPPGNYRALVRGNLEGISLDRVLSFSVGG